MIEIILITMYYSIIVFITFALFHNRILIVIWFVVLLNYLILICLFWYLLFTYIYIYIYIYIQVLFLRNLKLLVCLHYMSFVMRMYYYCFYLGFCWILKLNQKFKYKIDVWKFEQNISVEEYSITYNIAISNNSKAQW